MPGKTQKEDRRTRYTRQVIKEAFLKLLPLLNDESFFFEKVDI